MKRMMPLTLRIGAPGAGNPLLTRLFALADLAEADSDLLTRRANLVRQYPVRTQLISAGEAVVVPRGLLKGWAAQVHQLSDGRRQILQLLLPGDIIGATCTRAVGPPITTVALTPVTIVSLATLPDQHAGTPLADALATSAALTDMYLRNQVIRLGRQSAYERLGHLLLELRDRLDLAGECDGNRCTLPLTQELLADVLGLTSVHINRTLQSMRREEMIELSGGIVELLQPDTLATIADYQPAHRRVPMAR